MEQSATVATRVQLTLARLNIEEQRIAQLTPQLDQVRRELTAATLEWQKFSDELAEVEKVLQSTTDDKVRKSYGYEQEGLKRKLAAQARLEQQLRTRTIRRRRSTRSRRDGWISMAGSTNWSAY
jgi:hypothetical protein